MDADAAAALARLTGGSTRPAAPSAASTAQVPAPATDNNPSRTKQAREIPSAGAATASSAPSAVAAAPAEPALHSMREKLEYVAGFSKTSLYDSVAALCSWAAVSPPPTAGAAPLTPDAERAQKIDAFFHSQALEILLNTVLSDETQQLVARPEVKAAFQALLQHVLLPTMADANGNAAVSHITEALCALVGQVSALRAAQVLPAFVSSTSHGHNMLAGQIAACIKNLYFQLHPTPPTSTGGNGTAGDANLAASETDASNDDLITRLAAVDGQLAALEKGVKKGPSASADAAQEKVQNLFLSREILNDKLQMCVEVSIYVIICVAAGTCGRFHSPRTCPCNQLEPSSYCFPRIFFTFMRMRCLLCRVCSA
jgi:DNA-binding FrmR family transcriptional regulator